MAAAAPAPTTSDALKVSPPESVRVIIDSSHRVEAPLNNAAVAQRVIPAVLMEDAGEYPLNPQIFVCLVRERVPIISAISREALVKFRVGVRSLTNACLNAREDERRIVKAIQGSGLELFLYRLLRKLCARADCSKVRHYPENSLGLLFFRRDLARRSVGRRGALRFRSIG